MMDKGSIMLYGHLHGHKDSYLQQYSNMFRITDVGIDTNNLYPYNIKNIGKEMQHKITRERHNKT
jgi:calcineurin-like phosphoesterase family protein